MINSALQIYIKTSLFFCKRDTKDYTTKVLFLTLMFLPDICNCIFSYRTNSLWSIYTWSPKPSTIMLNSICIICLEVSTTTFYSLSWITCFHH